MPVRQRLAAGDQPLRIEIALYRAFLLQALRLRQRHGPVEAERGRARRCPIAVIAAAGALGEGDDRDIRMGCANLPDDLGDRLDAESLESSLRPSTPDQESKICTASAPASICRMR